MAHALEDDVDILSFQVYARANVDYTMKSSKPILARFNHQTLAARIASQIKKKAPSLPSEASKNAKSLGAGWLRKQIPTWPPNKYSRDKTHVMSH